MQGTLPGKSFAPLRVYSRDIRKTLFPFRFPSLMPFNGRTV